MARIGVTYQEIAIAAEQLKGQDKNVTIENIRSVLGTGSIGTINKYLRQWREQDTKTLACDNVPENLTGMIKGLWDRLMTESVEKFTPIETGMKEEISILTIELEKYKTNNKRWQKLFIQWQQEKNNLSDENRALDQSLQFAHKEIASLNAGHEGLRQQLQEKQERVDELHQLHKQVQTNLEHYRESVYQQRMMEQQQFEQQKQELVAENRTLKNTTMIQERKLLDLQRNVQALQASCQKFENDFSVLQKENTELNIKLDKAEKSHHETSAACAVWQSQNRDMLILISEKSAKLAESFAENSILSRELSILKKNLEILQKTGSDQAN